MTVQPKNANLRYRPENVSFKTREDLEKVSDLDAEKIEAHRGRLGSGTR
jgi:DNA uptake protein ComE-like DNA-binding protein